MTRLWRRISGCRFCPRVTRVWGEEDEHASEVDEQRRERSERAAEARAMRLRLLATAIVLIAGVGAIAWLSGGRPVEPGDGEYVPASKDPLIAALPGLQSYVESVRGLDFEATPPVKIVAADELSRLKETSLRLPHVDRAATIRALGWPSPTPAIALGADVDATGYYSYRKQTIYLTRSGNDAYDRVAAVQQLMHALDDQNFRLLSRVRDAAVDIDQLAALTALIEGDAARVARAYVDSLPEDVRKEAMQSPHWDAKTSSYQGNLRAFPAELGETFVDYLASDGGNDAIDELFRSPPLSTAQILDPESYATSQGPVGTRPPTSQGKVLDQGTLGQVQLALLITGGKSVQNASTTAQWVGDAFRTVRKGGQVCVLATVQFDSDSARDVFARDLEKALGSAGQVMSSNLDQSAQFERCTS